MPVDLDSEMERAPETSRDLVRDIHDAVAHSDNPAEASTRPADTTRLELYLMVRDALAKLRLERSTALIEVGCGTGIFALPIAQRVARYVGLDFASAALDVLRERLEREGIAAEWELRASDFLEADLSEFEGRFDRALMYAVIHYARTDDDGVAFLRRIATCLRPGGRALIGNVPLAELREDGPRVTPGAPVSRRLRELAGWVGGQDDVARRPAGWKLRAIAVLALKARAAGKPGGFETASLPAGYTVELTRERIETWLGQLDGVEHRWLLPAPGTPLFLSRADLLLVRR